MQHRLSLTLAAPFPQNSVLETHLTPQNKWELADIQLVTWSKVTCGVADWPVKQQPDTLAPTSAMVCR
jgi:hypothetical protein